MVIKMAKIREVSKLEQKFILSVVEVSNGEYKSVPRSLIPSANLVKVNQLNAVINNLKAIGIIRVKSDLLENTIVELTQLGKHAYRKILRDEKKALN